jgi:hypothetical protein
MLNLLHQLALKITKYSFTKEQHFGFEAAA